MVEPRTAVESVFRAKYGELRASLLGTFGYGRFDVVEEALQIGRSGAVRAGVGLLGDEHAVETEPRLS